MSAGADLVESGVLNPVDCENWISETSSRIAKGVGVVTLAERQAKAARRAYDLAYALAYANTTTSAHIRKFEAEAATMELREAPRTRRLRSATPSAPRGRWSGS